MAVAEKYPQYTNGIAVSSKNEKNSYCYICPNKLPIASEEHLKNSDHLSALAYYLHNFTDNGPFVSCKLCSMRLEYSSIKEHAITHKLMPWYRPEEEFKIFYVNWISSKDNEYYCHLCDVKLSSWFNAIFHTEEMKHRALRGDTINEAAIKELPFTLIYYREIGCLRSFMRTSKSSMCALCCVPSGALYNQILKHSEDTIHIRNEEAFKETLKKTSVHVPPIAGSFDCDYYSNRVDDSAESKSDDGMIQIGHSFCTVCQRVIDSRGIKAHLEKHADDVPDSTGNSTEGSMNSREKGGCDMEKEDAISQNTCLSTDKNIKTCRISLGKNETETLHDEIHRNSDQLQVRKIDRECKISTESKSSSQDLSTKTDTDAGEMSLLPEGICYFFPVYKCTLCDYDIAKRMNIKSHIDTPYHQNNLQLQREKKGKMPDNNKLKSSLGDSSRTSANGEAKAKNKTDVEDFSEEVLFLFDTIYRCTLCKCHINGRVNIQEHIDAVHHQYNLRLWKKKEGKIPNNVDVTPANSQKNQPLPQDVVMVEKPNFFWCKTCSVKINGYKNVIEHVNAPKHSNKKLGLSTSTLTINSDSSNYNLENNSKKGLVPAEVPKESLMKNDSVEMNNESLASSSTLQVDCSPREVNVEGSETLMAKKKKVRRRNKKKMIDTDNIVSASAQKIHSNNEIGACEVHSEEKKSSGKDDSSKYDSGNIKVGGFAELLSNGNAEECKPSTMEKVNVPESYKFAQTPAEKLKMIRFVGGKEVEAVDIPEEFIRITRRNYFCLLCNCNLIGGESIFKHIKAAAHEEDFVKKNEEDECMNKSAATDVEPLRLIEKSAVIEKLSPYIVAAERANQYWCQICSVQITSYISILEHENDTKHKKNMNPLNEPESYIFAETSPGKLKVVRFVEGEEVEAVDIPGEFRRITRRNYFCLSCNCNLIGGESIFKHIKAAAHEEDFVEKNKEDKRMNESALIDGKSELNEKSADVQKLPPHIVATEGENEYCCQICSVKITSYKNILEHENGTKHKKNMNSVDLTFDQSLFPEITVMAERRNEFWCKVCFVKIYGPKTVVQHVNSPKHMNQVKEPLNLSISRDCSSGVSDKKNSEPIPITSNGMNWETNNYPSLPSASPEKYELCNDKISLNSIVGHDDEKLNNNRELMRESVESIYSSGDEVFMTECRICKAVILGDSRSLMEHVNSRRHEESRFIVSYLQGPEFGLKMEPKLIKHDEIKYFIADKQVEGDESVIKVVEVPKGGTKDSGIYFIWCSACCIKVYDDSRLNEHLKSPFHLKNSKEKLIICKYPDERDDNDDSESNEKDQHKIYPEEIKEIHGENYFLCTICNGLKLFGKDSVFEHVKSLVHSNNLQRSLESGETGEDDVFSNEINWKTSETSVGGEETTAQSLSPNSQSKNAEGSSSENDFFSCSSEEDSKINAGPSEAQMVTPMARMNLNSEENEKASQDTEVPFSEGSCSSLSYGQRDEDDWIQLCTESDGSVDYYRMGDEYVELEAEFSVSESASTSRIPENIRVPEKQASSSLGEVYNIKGTDIWICLACNKHQIYTLNSIKEHLTNIQHTERKKQMIFEAPKPLNNTKFIISLQFRSEGIVEVPTKEFAVCTFCQCKLASGTQAETHVSSVEHQACKNSIINKRNEGKSESIQPLSSQQSLPDGNEKFSNKNFFLCTLCRKKLADYSEIEKHVRSSNHKQRGKKVIFNVDEDKFRCERCDIILSGYSALVNHLNSAQHTAALNSQIMKSYDLLKKLEENPQQVLNDLNSKKSIPNYIRIQPGGILKLQKICTNWCMKCNCRISEDNLQFHLSGKYHRETSEGNEPTQDNQIFHCKLCRRDVIGDESWESHILGAGHKRNERALPVASLAEVSDKVSVESPRRIQPMISNFQSAESDNSLEEEETSGSGKPGGAKIPQKYQPMVDCNICHCKIPGGDANISNHRNSREHKNNEAKLFARPITPADTGNYVGNVSANPRSFNANIPLDAYSQYHYRHDGSIDFIECKVCNFNIHGMGDFSVNYVYAFHLQSEVHKLKEMEFAKKWRPSPGPSMYSSITRFNGLEGERAVCPICHEVLKSKNLLHSHMTSHFWTRFTKNPPPITENLPEKPAKSEPSRSTEDSDEELVINESPMKPLKRRHFRRKPLDIEVTDPANIYDIDKQKMSEIRAGVLLSLPKDKDIIYCLICRCNVSNNLQTFYEHLCSVKHLDYLKDMLDDDKLFQNSENQFSDLALGYEYMKDISDAAVKCHACDISIENEFPKLYKHINSDNHIDKWTALDTNSRELFRGLKSKMECDFYSVKWYWCVICNLKFITECEFQKHLMRRKHLKKIRKFGDQFMMFDYCGVCASLWYGFLKTFSYHSDCTTHKYHELDEFFSINKLPESVERLLNSAEQDIEVTLRDLEFCRAIDKSKEDQLLRDLRKIAIAKYPNADVHPFGSRITGLRGKTSDLDVFLDCPTQNNCMYFGENSHHELIKRRLLKIKESLQNNTNIWLIDREILDCRIPIIKAKHKPTDIECDLSFTNGLTVENTALIRNYCDKSADCRKLIICIKRWMNHCELSGANGINSYGIAWLVIYFLQTKKILPTVNQLIEMNNKSQIIAGWETGVSKDFQVQTFDGSFGELLKEFFKFYGNFDYRHDVICPLLGEIVKKVDFQHRDELPSAMGPYLNYLRDASDAEPFRVDSIMCLQDPFDLAHNITKAVKKFNIYKFKTFCCYSTKIIGNNV